MTEESGPQGALRTALIFLSQAEELCRTVDPWLGWRPGTQPLVVTFVQGGNLLVGVTDPPAGFRPMAVGGAGDAQGLTAFYRPGFLDQRTLGVGVMAGRPRLSEVGGDLVSSVAFTLGRDPLASFGTLVRESFQAQKALELAARLDASVGVADEIDIGGLVDEGGASGAAGRGGGGAREGGGSRAGGKRQRNPLLDMAAMLRECQESFERYPENSVPNNVLGNLEGSVLHGLLAKDGFSGEAAQVAGAERPAAGTTGQDAGPGVGAVGLEQGAWMSSLARTMALIRRERWAQLTPGLIAYERRMEIIEGLPRFVETVLLRAMAEGVASGASGATGTLMPEFLAITQEAPVQGAARLVRARFGLLTQLNRRGWGASRRRFYHSGMGMGFMLDATVPGWRNAVSSDRQPLDLVLESAVTFDGGDTDERLLELARRRYGYYDRLEDERTWSEDVGDRRRELLAKVLGAEGTRITVDVSALNEKTAWYDTSSAEKIGESVVVHIRPGVFTYGDGTTFVEFRGVAMVEDRRARLFHLTVPGTNLAIFGDADRVPGHKGAEFTEGLDVDLAGFRVRAQRGTVQRDGGILLISLLA